MIIRKTPKNIKNYLMVDSDTSVILHEHGYYPKYMSMDGKHYYYVKTENIINFINQNNLIVLD